MKKLEVFDQDMKVNHPQLNEKLDTMMFMAYYLEETIDSIDESKDAETETLFPYFKQKVQDLYINGQKFTNCLGVNLKKFDIAYKTSQMQFTWFTNSLEGRDPSSRCY